MANEILRDDRAGPTRDQAEVNTGVLLSEKSLVSSAAIHNYSRLVRSGE
jgi:hypothetical protein